MMQWNFKRTVPNIINRIPYNVCLIPECDKCIPIKRLCFKQGPYCYRLYCGINDWYKARRICQGLGKGSDLTILPNNMEAVTNMANSIPKSNPCSLFWIGLNTFSWRGQNGQSQC